MMVPGEELEDEAAVRQYATKASVPSYSDLTARHPPSSPPPSFPLQPPKEAITRSSRSRLHREKEPVQMLLLPAPPQGGGSDT